MAESDGEGGSGAFGQASRSNGEPQMCRVFLTCFLLAMAVADFAAARDNHGGEAVRMVNGYPVISAFFNGQGPFRMLVDTGAARCALRPATAARIGLVPKRQVLLTTVLGEQMVPAAETAVHLGSWGVLGTEVLIYNLPGLDRLASYVDGLLGQS